MQRAISEIIIGERCRKEMGDLVALANSIESVGLMHPVVVDSANNLIAGEQILGKQVIWSTKAA